MVVKVMMKRIAAVGVHHDEDDAGDSGSHAETKPEGIRNSAEVYSDDCNITEYHDADGGNNTECEEKEWEQPSSNILSSKPIAKSEAPRNPNQKTSMTPSTPNIQSGVALSEPVANREAPRNPNQETVVTLFTPNIQSAVTLSEPVASNAPIIPNQETGMAPSTSNITRNPTSILVEGSGGTSSELVSPNEEGNKAAIVVATVSHAAVGKRMNNKPAIRASLKNNL